MRLFGGASVCTVVSGVVDQAKGQRRCLSKEEKRPVENETVEVETAKAESSTVSRMRRDCAIEEDERARAERRRKERTFLRQLDCSTRSSSRQKEGGREGARGNLVFTASGKRKNSSTAIVVRGYIASSSSISLVRPAA